MSIVLSYLCVGILLFLEIKLFEFFQFGTGTKEFSNKKIEEYKKIKEKNIKEEIINSPDYNGEEVFVDYNGSPYGGCLTIKVGDKVICANIN